MPEETKSVDYAMEAASGPHFSGLRLDVLRSSPSSSPRSNPVQAISSSTTSLPTSQPFIIGIFSISLSLPSPYKYAICTIYAVYV